MKFESRAVLGCELEPELVVRCGGGAQGDMGRILVRHEWGNGIMDETAPMGGEKVVFKAGKGAFFGTDLHSYLL